VRKRSTARLQFDGRFYEKSTSMLGMTPTQYRAGGRMKKSASLLANPRSVRSGCFEHEGVASILLGKIPTRCCAIFRTGSPKPD